MSVSLQRDIGDYLRANFGDFVSVTAGGGGDGSEVDGEWIDRQGWESAKLVIGFETTLQATETLQIAANIQDATDSSGSGSADFGDAVTAATFATGASGGSTENGVVVLNVDLTGANQFVRSQFTPTLSASSTDTADLMAVWVFGGADELPSADRDN